MSKGLLRILTAVVGAPLVLGATFLGGLYFALLIALAAAACQYEFYQLGRAGHNRVLKGITLVGGFSIPFGFVWPEAWIASACAMLLLVCVFPFVYSEDRAVSELAVLLAGFIYPVLFLATLVGVRLSTHPAALYVTVLSVVLVWASDSFAYYVGKGIGKHQLTAISPKKTWEGSVGGLLGAALVAACLKFWWFGDLIDWPFLLLLVLVCGAIGQIGDIFESKLKRAANVKDSGSILPGHGGMLDRLDAILFVAPIVYILFVAVSAST